MFCGEENFVRQDGPGIVSRKETWLDSSDIFLGKGAQIDGSDSLLGNGTWSDGMDQTFYQGRELSQTGKIYSCGVEQHCIRWVRYLLKKVAQSDWSDVFSEKGAQLDRSDSLLANAAWFYRFDVIPGKGDLSYGSDSANLDNFSG